MLATEAADYFVRQGVPFREAHELAGQMVREAEALGKPLTQLPESTLKSIYPKVTGELRACMTLDAALASKKTLGGTAPETVRAAIAECRARLAKQEGAR